MRLGVSSYTYVWAVGVPGYPILAQPMTAQQLLAKAAELEVRVVQIGDNLPLDRLTEAELAALAERAQAMRIDLEIGTCGIAPGNLRRYVAIARQLKSPILRTLLDTAGHQPTPDEAVATLKSLADDFVRAGVRLAIENHDRFRAETLVDIIKRVGGDWLGICLDTANSLACLETPAMVVETLGPWTINLHIKDFRFARLPHHKGFAVEGCPAGQGQLDIPRLLATLCEQGRDCNAIVELWPPPEPTIDESVSKEDAWARTSVRYLREFIKD
jgi:sugar phosphate isomerase/epimerase